MKEFETIITNREQCRAELERFRALLSTKDRELSEDKDLLSLFQECKQLTALLGSFHPRMSITDKIAHEFNLDDFRCDFAVGDTKRSSYCLIEFEDAKRDSVFRSVGRFISEWSPRFEHGFSQLVDWSYKLNEMEKTPDFFEAKFGSRTIDFMFMLVVGREEFLSMFEKNRLNWRWKHVVVNSQQIRCLTYDQFLQELDFAIETYPTAAEIEASTTPPPTS